MDRPDGGRQTADKNVSKAETESLSTQTSNKDRSGCDSSLLLLINSASYKMSTTSHTDRIQRGSL